MGRAPDVVIDLGGLNDNGQIGGSAATMQAAVQTWLQTLIAALPNVLVFMTGQMAPGTAADTGTNYVAVRDGKKAAAAAFPNNVVFIDNIAELWVAGTGNAAAPAGNGDADWVTTTDSTHPTDAGHTYLARRIVGGIAARLAQAPTF